MMRLIDADELIPIIKMGEMNEYCELGEGRNGGIAFAIDRINQMPTIEPKKGKWIDCGVHGDWAWEQDGHGNFWHIWKCSKCGYTSEYHSNYCPNCGADMRGGA